MNDNQLTDQIQKNYQAHPFHLVSPSPWPLLTCISLMSLTSSGVLTMHVFSKAIFFFVSSLFSLMLSMSLWWRDIMSEATYMGNHTWAVKTGHDMGIALFIVSEALFFLAMFWTYFHCSVYPLGVVGADWPPMGMEMVNPFELPLLNTVMLLSSSFTVTYTYHSIMKGKSNGALNGLVATVLLATVFTCLQGLEYTVSPFTMSDSIYGSSFYFATGFHGLHVMMGTAFMVVGLWSVLAYHSSDEHHLGLESSILYWHFVDVVWMFLYISMYYLGYK